MLCLWKFAKNHVRNVLLFVNRSIMQLPVTVCAVQNTHFYSYKLHAVCSLQGVFHSFDLTAASVHYIHYLKDVKEQISNATLIADKGYLSADLQLDLF